MTVAFSVVIPVKEEEGNVASLLAEIREVMSGRAYEVIFVDDCSLDATADVLLAERANAPELRIIRHPQNCGQSSAIRTGVLCAKGETIITLDGDGQNDPHDIPNLLALYEEKAGPNLGMVGGQRTKRQDTWGKRMASGIANRVRSSLLGDHTRDTGCGLKVFSKAAYLRLPYFSAMHRFLPALFLREGFEIHFVDVGHRPRGAGQSKYGVFDRALQSIPDLLGVMWLRRRTRLPSERIEL